MVSYMANWEYDGIVCEMVLTGMVIHSMMRVDGGIAMKREKVTQLIEAVHAKGIDLHDYLIMKDTVSQLVLHAGMDARRYLYSDMLYIIVSIGMHGRTVFSMGQYEEYPEGTYAMTVDEITVTTLQGTVIRLAIRCKE